MSVQQRLHSIDNLRAVMMWLGIVLHVADLHITSHWPLPWHDQRTNPLADLLVVSIHTFRMPAFFIVAGFFVALLAKRRGIAGMLANRLRRIGLPLLVFWPVLFAVYVLLATYSHRAPGDGGGPWLDISALPLLRDGSRWQLMHLWFLQVLLGLAVASAVPLAAARRISEGHRRRLSVQFEWLAARPWAAVGLSVPLALVSRSYPLGILSASAQLLPPANEWVYCGSFFGFGVVLYHSREKLLPLLERRCWFNLAAGSALFCLELFLLDMKQRNVGAFSLLDPFWTALVFNTCTWLWCLGLLGAFGRYVSAQTPFLEFSARSSYWVYLVHLPVVIGVHLMLRDLPIAALLKLAINIAMTSAIGALSYRFLIRHTMVDVFLNGRRENP